VAHRINGRARAMIVTRSRLHAVRYHRALERYLKEQGYDHGALVAFSGTVRDGGIEHTEANLNGISETQTKSVRARREPVPRRRQLCGGAGVPCRTESAEAREGQGARPRNSSAIARLSNAATRDAAALECNETPAPPHLFQTGFDQPLLHTMHVDRKLGGVNAVQTLSRLNRTPPAKDGTMQA
jgi:type I restriction enzyme, R subunit